jgi:hypothetical protein
MENKSFCERVVESLEGARILPGERDQLDSHIAECEECQKLVNEARTIRVHAEPFVNTIGK